MPQTAEPLTIHAQDDIEKLAKMAEASYAALEERLGGMPAIKEYEERSKYLRDKVRQRLGKKSPWRQDILVHKRSKSTSSRKTM